MAEEVKQEVEMPTITAGDLATMVNIIDAGSQRGAWRGEELSAIGNLRTKLAEVVKAMSPEVEEKGEPVGEEAATEAATETDTPATDAGEESAG